MPLRFDVELGPDALVLRFHGFAALAAVRRRVSVPYRHIRAVEVGPLKTTAPRLWRLGGLSAGPLRFGTFRRGGAWVFVAVDRHGDVVQLELDGMGPERVRFATIAFSADDPHGLAAAIRARAGSAGPEPVAQP